MSAGTIEVTPVQDLEEMLEGVPPCEATRGPYSKPCTKPAIVRVRATCGSCTGTSTVFLCEHCVANLRRGDARCWPGCGAADFTWIST